MRKIVSNELTYAYSQNTSRMDVHGTVSKTGKDLFSITTSITDEEGNQLSSESFSDARVTWLKENKVSVEISGSVQTLTYYCKDGDFFIFDRIGNCYRSTNALERIERKNEEKVDTERILSPMSGMVVKVRATEGKTFKKGDVVAIVEAMKMEHIVTA